MNGRLYDPVVGRFLSADPYIQNPGFTQNYNRYSYCLNNPLKYTDLSGNQMTAYKYFMQNVFGESGGRGFDGYKGSDGLGGGGVDSGYYGSAGPSASGLSTADMINYLWYRGDVAGFWTPSTGFVFTHDGAFPGSKNGVQGIWYQSVSLEGHYQNWRDGVNSPDAYVNVSNKFIASSSSGQEKYDWGRPGNALNTGGIAYSALENAIANKYWWMDAKGNYNSTKILLKGANGKFIQGVQGYRNGYNSALNAASKFKIAGNIVGALGLGVTAVQWRTNQITGFEASVDAAFGVISFIGPIGAGIGATYFIGKLGYEYFSGNTVFEKPQ